jgi:hypothetical protein
MKYVAEALFLYTFYRTSGLSFLVLFGEGDASLLARFFRGELLMVVPSPVVPLLVVEVLVLTAVGGLWIGCTSSGSPVLEGVLAGTILAFFATMPTFPFCMPRSSHSQRPRPRPWHPITPRRVFSPDLCSRSSSMVVGALGGQQWRRDRAPRPVARARAARPRRSQ